MTIRADAPYLLRTVVTVLALSSCQAFAGCIPNSIGPGGCQSIGPGGGLSIGPGGGMSIGPGGGQSIGPGGGQSIGPGGGLSIAPGGGLSTGSEPRRWSPPGSNQTSNGSRTPGAPWVDAAGNFYSPNGALSARVDAQGNIFDLSGNHIGRMDAQGFLYDDVDGKIVNRASR